LSLPLSTILLLVLAALCAGVVDAIGGGGGLVTVPALLAAGLPAPLALGSNKGQSVFGSGAALLRYTRAGLVDGRVARASFPAGFAGSLAGAGLVLLVPPAALRPVVLVLLVAVAATLAFRPASPAPRQGRPRSRALRVAVLIAFALGAYDGFFGPGTGTFLIFAFVWFFEARLQEASADAKVVNFASNLAALFLFSSRGVVVWSVALPMAAGQACGGFIGAHMAVRGGDRMVRWVVLLVVLALVGKLAVDLVRG
jgi:uncharacterized membrane protein YfcA